MHNLRNFYSFTLRPFHSKNRCLLKRGKFLYLAATEQSENLLDLYFWEVNTVYTSGQSRVCSAMQGHRKRSDKKHI